VTGLDWISIEITNFDIDVRLLQLNCTQKSILNQIKVDGETMNLLKIVLLIYGTERRCKQDI
jgi:hypothetical protein